MIILLPKTFTNTKATFSFFFTLSETTICVVSDAFTAFYAGLVVFTCLGFLAKEADVSIEEVAKASGAEFCF